MKPKEYTIAWEEKYNTLNVDLFANASIKYKNIISNNINEYFSFIRDTYNVVVYYSVEDQEKLNREHGRYFLERGHIDALIKRYQKIISDYKVIHKYILNLNYNELDNKALLKVFNQYYDFFIELIAHYRSSRPEAEIEPMKKIKSILYLYFSAGKIDDIIPIITKSAKLNLIEKEKIDWFNLISKKNVSDNDIEKYILEYPSYYINIFSIEEIIRMCKEKIRKDKKRIKELKKEIDSKNKFIKDLPRKQKEIYKKCENNKNLIMYSRMMQEFGRYRFEVKNIWSGSELSFLPLFLEIAKRLKISLFELFNYYTINELKNAIKSNQSLAEYEIKKRKKCMAILVKGKKYEVLSGDKAFKFYKNCKLAIKITDILRGNVGYKGLVTGKVQIIYPTQIEDYKTFKKGNVLVTTYTQPSMVPIMALSSAIVTDGGGVTSHSAIVSRELKIPSVIGTVIATKILKDGMMVEVDADKGIVRIIK